MRKQPVDVVIRQADCRDLAAIRELVREGLNGLSFRAYFFGIFQSLLLQVSKIFFNTCGNIMLILPLGITASCWLRCCHVHIEVRPMFGRRMLSL